MTDKSYTLSWYQKEQITPASKWYQRLLRIQPKPIWQWHRYTKQLVGQAARDAEKGIYKDLDPRITTAFIQLDELINQVPYTPYYGGEWTGI